MEKLVDKMRTGREDQLEEVIAMQKTLKNALLKKNLKQHPALLQLLGVLRKREQAYSLILTNKENLSQEERSGMFERRREVRFILSFFESADKTIEGIRSQLEYQLGDEVQELSTEE